MKKLYQSPVLDVVLFEMERDILATSGAEGESPWGRRTGGISRSANREDQ